MPCSFSCTSVLRNSQQRACPTRVCASASRGAAARRPPGLALARNARMKRGHAVLLAFALAVCGCRLPYTGGARPVAPTALDAHWLQAAPTPVVRQQQEADCGLAALAMVAGAWGRQWSVGDLTQRIPPTHEGVRLGAL